MGVRLSPSRAAEHVQGRRRVGVHVRLRARAGRPRRRPGQLVEVRRGGGSHRPGETLGYCRRGPPLLRRLHRHA